jgi:hypothetical protein
MKKVFYKKIRYGTQRAVLLGVLMPVCMQAYFPLNIFQAYDINLYRPNRWAKTSIDLNVTDEFSVKTVGRTAKDELYNSPKKGIKTNVLQLWQEKQNALAMLEGFGPSSDLTLLAQRLAVDTADGCRGQFIFCGNLEVRANMLFLGRWYLPYGFIAALYLPVRALKLGVHFEDLTKDLTAEDVLTKNLLTNNFAQQMEQLGCLDINGWRRIGVGDLAALMHWFWDFPQEKPLLKKVRVNGRIGLSFPTAKKSDINQIFSIPLGNDGAWGIIFGGGLDLTLSSHIKIGLDAEFLQLFSVIDRFRIKTNVDQTDLLLLARARALKDFGFVHHFNLYAQFYDLPHGLSCDVIYQFFKQEDSKLALFSNEFSSEVANTAKSLEEWTMHHFIFKVNYDFESMLKDYPLKPYCSFFFKQPVNGKNAVLAQTVGFSLVVSF